MISSDQGKFFISKNKQVWILMIFDKIDRYDIGVDNIKHKEDYWPNNLMSIMGFVNYLFQGVS